MSLTGDNVTGFLLITAAHDRSKPRLRRDCVPTQNASYEWPRDDAREAVAAWRASGLDVESEAKRLILSREWTIARLEYHRWEWRESADGLGFVVRGTVQAGDEVHWTRIVGARNDYGVTADTGVINATVDRLREWGVQFKPVAEAIDPSGEH